MIFKDRKMRFKFKKSGTTNEAAVKKQTLYGSPVSTGLINTNPTDTTFVSQTAVSVNEEKPKLKIRFVPRSDNGLGGRKKLEEMVIDDYTKDEKHEETPSKPYRPIRLAFKKIENEQKTETVVPEKVFSDSGIKTGLLSGGAQNIFVVSEEMFGKKMPEKTIVDGYEIPDIENVDVVKIMQMPEKELRTVDVKYPLIPSHPKKNEPVFAYAHIYWDFKTNQLVYDVIEPNLTDEERKEIDEIKEYIEEKLDINFAAVRKKEAADYIKKMFEDAVAYFRIKNEMRRAVYTYFIVKDFIGLGKIDPLINDNLLEDISCDGIGIPIYIYHRNPKYGSLRTNISFVTKEELDSFVMKISERCGKNISVAKPMLDGTLPDGSRIQATLGSDIARLGSNFTIRKFTEDPLTPVDLIELGTIDLKMTAFLWLCIDYGVSVMVSGGTATGKTSMLNVLSLFIRPQLKIVSIEDTAELRLPHPHWIPEVARVPIEQKGEIDMYELLRESLRQRPDYIIVGEVRGREAYVLFQQMSIGHPSLSTIHAESIEKLIDRLTTAPISLPANLLQNLDIIMFLKRVRKGNKVFRRVEVVEEVTGFNRKDNVPISNTLFKWDPEKDEFKITSKSVLLKKFASAMDKNEDEIKEEIEKRAVVLRWMIQRGVKDYRQIGKIINMYYASPDYLVQRVGAEVR